MQPKLMADVFVQKEIPMAEKKSLESQYLNGILSLNLEPFKMFKDREAQSLSLATLQYSLHVMLLISQM